MMEVVVQKKQVITVNTATLDSRRQARREVAGVDSSVLG